MMGSSWNLFVNFDENISSKIVHVMQIIMDRKFTRINYIEPLEVFLDLKHRDRQKTSVEMHTSTHSYRCYLNWYGAVVADDLILRRTLFLLDLFPFFGCGGPMEKAFEPSVLGVFGEQAWQFGHGNNSVRPSLQRNQHVSAKKGILYQYSSGM